MSLLRVGLTGGIGAGKTAVADIWRERGAFIIDSDGKVAEVLRKVKPAEHDALVLSALAEASP